jgi:ubiquinone/menaquinone biosynthesis C-methylase UbiE
MNIANARERYQIEAVAASYDAKRFRGVRGRTIDALEKRAIRRALAHVLRQLPFPRVLDAPCGTGRITEILLDDGLPVTGGDLSLPMLERARRKLAHYGEQINWRQLDLEALDLPDGSFDLVTCIRLFNHLGTAQRQRILQELARVTTGFVILNMSFSTPFYRVVSQFKRVAGVPMPKEPSTWNDLCQQVRDAGLCIDAYYYELRYLSEVVVLLLKKVTPPPRLDK